MNKQILKHKSYKSINIYGYNVGNEISEEENKRS